MRFPATPPPITCALQLSWYVDTIDMLSVNAASVDTGLDKKAPADAESARARLLQMGAALMSVGTFFNHSCEPNVQMGSAMADRGGIVDFFATRDIAVGEELTISYINDAPLAQRQFQLKFQYRFECKCSKCLRESPAP